MSTPLNTMRFVWTMVLHAERCFIHIVLRLKYKPLVIQTQIINIPKYTNLETIVTL